MQPLKNSQLAARLLLAGYLAARLASAQTLDATAQVQNLLALNGPVPYTHLVQKETTRYVCYPIPHTGEYNCQDRPYTTQISQTDQVSLTPSNVRIVSSTPVKLDPLVRNEIPSQVTASAQEFVNCSAVNSQQSINLQVAFQRSASAALSTSVTHTNTFTVSASGGPGFFTVGASFSIGSSDTTGTVNTTGTSMTVTRSSTSSVTLAKGQAVVAEIEVWPVQYTQTFHTSVTVDADLSANDKYAHLSDLFPDAARRTFPITGTIQINDASDGKTVQFDDQAGAASCQPGDTGVKPMAYVPSTDAKLVLRQ